MQRAIHQNECMGFAISDENGLAADSCRSPRVGDCVWAVVGPSFQTQAGLSWKTCSFFASFNRLKCFVVDGKRLCLGPGFLGAWPGTVDSRGPPFPGLFGGSYGAAGRAPNAAWELLGSWGELTSRTEFHLFRQLKPMRLSNLS